MEGWTNNKVWTRIDRALGNLNWYDEFPNSSVLCSEIGPISDHAYLIVSTTPSHSRGVCSFKFSNAIAEVPDFLPTVDTDNNSVQGCKSYQLCRKLKEKNPQSSFPIELLQHFRKN